MKKRIKRKLVSPEAKSDSVYPDEFSLDIPPYVFNFWDSNLKDFVPGFKGRTYSDCDKEGVLVLSLFHWNKSLSFSSVAEMRKHLSDYFYSVCVNPPRRVSLSNRSKALPLDLIKVVVNKDIAVTLQTFLADNGLEKFHDLFFFLAAKVQSIYLEEIIFTEKTKAQINELSVQCSKLIELLQKQVERKKEAPWKHVARADKITVQFDDGKTSYSISETVLVDVIMGKLVRDFQDTEGDWRESIRSIPQHILTHNSLSNEFKYRIVQSLTKFLTEQTDLKPEKGNKTSDLQFKFISIFFNLCQIQILDKEGKSIEHDREVDIDRIRILRHWNNKKLFSPPNSVITKGINPL